MRKSKQKPDQSQPDSALGLDQLLSQTGYPSAAADDLGELAGEVQSFIARRNELLRRLNLEIEATEKKLLELRRTKERLFPDGSLSALAELELVERKPKRTKVVKTTQVSTEVHAVQAGGPQAPASPEPAQVPQVIHHETTIVIHTAAEAAAPAIVPAADHGSLAMAKSSSYLHIADSLVSREPLLSFHPAQQPEAHPSIAVRSVAELPARAWHAAPSLPTAAPLRAGDDSASSLRIERGSVSTHANTRRAHAGPCRLQRMLRTKIQRPRRLPPWSRNMTSVSSSGSPGKTARNRIMLASAPLFSRSIIADKVPGLKKLPRVCRAIRLPALQRDRRVARRLYKPRWVGSSARLLPLQWRHEGFSLGLDRSRSAA
jgi:hypothetical protein